jgi:hypothetical protein
VKIKKWPGNNRGNGINKSEKYQWQSGKSERKYQYNGVKGGI